MFVGLLAIQIQPSRNETARDHPHTKQAASDPVRYGPGVLYQTRAFRTIF